MNIELEISASISKVSLKTVQKDDQIRRVCRVTFARDFDSTIAAALGIDAKTALEGLRSHGMKKVVLPLGTILAKGTLRFSGNKTTAKAQVTISALQGVEAVGTASPDDDDADEAPRLTLSFDFDFEEGAWSFLGRHHTSWADITLRSLQTTLAFPEPKRDEDNLVF